MGERKGTNKYYPPDFDPGKGSLNAYHGTHALRERARKIHEGIIIIRFEMPYNIWCNGCGNHIGMGVRYNAQKRKVGNYYTTPIYKFRMKCHLCDQHFEIQTDPKNCDYVILSGARRKEERWDPAVTENIQATDRDVKAKLISDAMFKLEHSIEDKQKAKRAAPTINQIRHMRDDWEDDYAISQLLRKKFREEKKEMSAQAVLDEQFKERNLLPSSMELEKETDEDINLAKRIRYGEDLRPDIKRKIARQEIKHSAIFEKKINSKEKLALHLAGLARRKRNPSTNITANFLQPAKANVIIERKTGSDNEKAFIRNSVDVLDSRRTIGEIDDATSVDYEHNSIDSGEESGLAKESGSLEVTRPFHPSSEQDVNNPGNAGGQRDLKDPTSVKRQSERISIHRTCDPTKKSGITNPGNSGEQREIKNVASVEQSQRAFMPWAHDPTSKPDITNPGNPGSRDSKGIVSVEDQRLSRRQSDTEARISATGTIDSCSTSEKLDSKGHLSANSKSSLVAEYGSSSDESEEIVTN